MRFWPLVSSGTGTGPRVPGISAVVLIVGVESQNVGLLAMSRKWKEGRRFEGPRSELALF